MDTKFQKTSDYVATFLKWLTPDGKLTHSAEGAFAVELAGEITEVRFDRAFLEDFETALEKFKDTNYFYTLESRIQFRFYCALGIKGQIPYVQISSILLNEKGEWLKVTSAHVAFDKEFCLVLYRGLKLLSGSIENTLASGVKLPEVESEKCAIDNLIEYFDQHGHLSSTGAGIESLSYLKAAVVCIILEKEAAKRMALVPRVRRALDAEIYALVAKIRDDPFRDIKLPEAMHDYVKQVGTSDIEKSSREVRKEEVYVENARINELLERLDPRLKRRRDGAWAALSSDNPDKLSQAANSMVELLDQVISQACKDADLATFLTEKYQTHQKTEWVNATRKWIQQTKDNLHSAKHHVDPQSEQLTKTLLETAEKIIVVVLE